MTKTITGIEDDVISTVRRMDIFAVLRIIRRRMATIIGTTIIVLISSIMVMFALTPRFTSTSVVLIDPRQMHVTSAADVLSGIGSDNAAVESQVEVVESPTLAMRVIKKLSLDQDPEFSQTKTFPILETISSFCLFKCSDVSSGSESEKNESKLIEKFSDKLKVKRRGLTYIIEISFTSTDAKKSALIANTIADVYLTDQLDTKLEATNRASAWLSERTEDIRRKVAESENAVVEYRKSHDLVRAGTESGATTDLVDRQIGEINQQVLSARAAVAELKGQYDLVVNGGDDLSTLPASLQSALIAQLRSQASDASKRLAEASSRYGSGHPEVKRASAQVSDIRNAIVQENKRIAIGIKNSYDAAMSRLKTLEDSLETSKEEAEQNNKAMVKLKELERESESNRILYQQLLQRFKETTEQEKIQAPDARIIAPAVLPLFPSFPKKLLLSTLASLVGLISGIGLAFVRENAESGFRTSQQVEKELSLGFIGLLPMIKRHTKWSLTSWLDKLFSRIEIKKESDDPKKSIMRYGVDHPLSQFAEGLRSIDIGLKTFNPNAKIVLVVSALPNEGKSTTAANLAFMQAQNGKKVLLIDGDLRNPSLSRSLSDNLHEVGLVEILNNESTLDNVIVKDIIPGLDFLQTHRDKPLKHTAELIKKETFSKLLSDTSKSYDLIIIDGSPILPVVDSRILMEMVDAAILVVEWEKTDRDAVRNAIRIVRDQKSKFIGTVLTKVYTGIYRYYDASYGNSYRNYGYIEH